MKKIKVGVLGATGMVGQRFVSLLEGHPWFEVVCLAASPASAGNKYGEIVKKRWVMETPVPKRLKNVTVMAIERDFKKIINQVDVVFCAIDLNKEKVQKIEEQYASAGVAVVSNNSGHRWTPDVPMMIPEVNAEHIKLIEIQRKKRGWTTGLIAVKPNCSIQSYVAILTALKKFQPVKVSVVSMQSISGAGKTFATWPEMVDNLIPYIGGEEEKSELEPMKIWSSLKGNKLHLAKSLKIVATCVRVASSNGHMAAVSVKFKIKPTRNQIFQAIERYNTSHPLVSLKLPSSPKKFITFFEEEDRPQMKNERNLGQGMGICMGRLHEDKLFDWKFIAFSHNTIRGAAGGAILTAELLYKKGYIVASPPR